MQDKKIIYLVAGARPNFIKIAPLWREFIARKDKYQIKIVHTGQHYDYMMSEVFFQQLELPEPDFFLEVGSGSHSYQTAEIMLTFEKITHASKPDLVIVVGDVNSTLAAALSATKLHIPVAHVEAGLRSFDRKMPEEINRVLTDHLAELLFVSEPSGIANLSHEGISPKKRFLVGNVMIDELKYNLEKITSFHTTQAMHLASASYSLVTLHRPANVDNKDNLSLILKILKETAQKLKVIFPIHPRTRKNIQEFNLEETLTSIENLVVTDPLGYFEFMNLMLNSRLVITDSGGVQEETTWLGIPCITLRENTERPLTVKEGTNRITGLNYEKFIEALKWAQTFDNKNYIPPKLWDGQAAKRIIKIIDAYFN